MQKSNIVDPLIVTLQELVKTYRGLLKIVHEENNVLNEIDVVKLTELNLAKEQVIEKVKKLEVLWKKQAEKIAHSFGIDTQSPKLRDLENVVNGPAGNQLNSLRKVLKMLCVRVQEVNTQNEKLVASASSHIKGAMDAIARNMGDAPLYGQGGDMDAKAKGKAGRLIAKEV